MRKRDIHTRGHAIHQPDRAPQGRDLSMRRSIAMGLVGEVVYAVRIGDVVKIGHTADLARRFSELRADQVLAFKPGTLDDEQAIHAMLDGHQHHAVEYYYPTPAVLAVVNQMRVALGLEPVAA